MTVELITGLQLGKFDGAAERLGEIAKISFGRQFKAQWQPVVGLACTELPLAFQEQKVLATFAYEGVLYINTTAAHINAAFDSLLVKWSRLSREPSLGCFHWRR